MPFFFPFTGLIRKKVVSLDWISIFLFLCPLKCLKLLLKNDMILGRITMAD